MREPADDSGDEQRSRRHGHRARAAGLAGRLGSARGRGPDSSGSAGGGQGGRDAPGGSGPVGRHSAGGAVFTPGYSRAEGEPDRRGGRTAGQPDLGRGTPPGRQYGPPPGSTAGRGPVRGYAPPPGQPPPVYPPGQFAAWNRHREGHAGLPAPSDGQDGPPTGLAPADSQRTQPTQGSRPGHYYAQDADSGTELGYPMLAISDPAADVTSTQTWRAISEGRSTGIWTAPPGLREGAPGGAASPDHTSTPPAGPAAPLTRRAGRHGSGSAPAAGGARTNTGSNPRVSTGPQSRIGTGPQPRISTGPQARISTGPQPRIGTGPQPRVGTGPQPRAGTGPQPRIGVGADPSAAGDRSRRSRRPRPASVKLAIIAALVLVVAAAATLIYTVVHDAHKTKLTSQPPSKPSATASASASLGPYGDIASRQTDPQPLTLTELYPASFTTSGQTVTGVASSLSGDCASAIDGASLQSAAGAANCTQAARATYVETPNGIMATIGVLNLSSGDAAKSAAQSADANDFISQLPASSGSAQRIGQGTGIEEALAKGHYLILVWAELTNLQNPSSQQATAIETFMTELVQNTVNKSLTTRMLTGAP